jgi:hypothetical protein
MFKLIDNEGAYNAIGEQLEIYQNVRDLTEMLVKYLREKDPDIQKQIADKMKFPDASTWMLYKLYAYGDTRVKASMQFKPIDTWGDLVRHSCVPRYVCARRLHMLATCTEERGGNNEISFYTSAWNLGEASHEYFFRLFNPDTPILQVLRDELMIQVLSFRDFQASWRSHEYDPRGKWMNYEPDDRNFTIEI